MNVMNLIILSNEKEDGSINQILLIGPGVRSSGGTLWRDLILSTHK